MRNTTWFLFGVLIVTALAWSKQTFAGGTNGQSQGQIQQQQQAVGVDVGVDNKSNSHAVSNSNSHATGGAGGAGGSGGSAVSGVKESGNSTNTNSVSSGSSSVSQGGAAFNGGNVQSSTDVVERSAPSVGLGVIAPNGCGAGVQGGGSGTGGAGMLGFAWTTSECYAFILAQSYNAIGDRKTACLVLNTTNAARRAAKRGLVLPSCEVTTVVTQGYTPEQVNAIVKKAVSK